MARYRFGAHELDLDRQELRHQGDPVEIDVKALGTLRVLLEHNERVVPKEELLARVWEGIHVSDTVVHSAVARLRKALGQSRGDNSPVATVHRRGYRVVLPVDRRTMPNASADALPASTGPQDPPLLGREGLLENLERATAGVRAGNGQLILLEGPSGIGKTRLCQELSMRTGTGSTRTLWGRCLETHGAADLWPWTRILRDCLAEIEWTEPEHVPPLREALTPLLSLGGCSDEPAVGEAARYRMFDAVRETIARVAEKRARLLVLDDLQYADPTSLELLAFLATQIDHIPVMLLCTWTPEVVLQHSPAEALRKRLDASLPAQVITVPGLDAQAIARWVEQQHGDINLAPSLWERTGGNPLFVRESLRLLDQEGRSPDCEARKPESMPVPEGIKFVLRRRLRRLQTPWLSLLGAASAIGKEFDLGLLAQCAGCSTEHASEGLQHATELGVVRMLTDANSRFRFEHDLIRQTLYEDLDRRERAALHLTVADALQRRAGAGGLNDREIAHHRVRALPSGAPMQAVDACRRAAKHAQRACAYEAESDLCEQALEALDLLPDPPVTIRMDLQIALGSALGRSGNIDGAWTQLDRAVHQARCIGDVERMARAALAIRPLYVLVAPDDRSRRVLEEIERRVDELPPDTSARVLARLAMAAPQAMPIEKRRDLAHRAGLAAESSEDPQTQIDVNSARLQSLQGPDTLEDLDQMAQKVSKDAERLQASESTLEALASRYLAALMRCDGPSAAHIWQQFGELAASHPHPLYRWHHQRCETQRWMYSGRLADAASAFKKMHPIAQTLHPELADLFLRVQKNCLIRLSEDPTRFRHIEVEPFIKRYRGAGCNLEAGVLLFLAESGRLEAAREGLEQLCRDDCSRITRGLEYVATICNLAEVAVLVHDTEHARLLIEKLTPYAELASVTALALYDGAGAFYLGLMHRMLGNLDEAVAQHERALQLHKQLDSLPMITRSHIELAGLLHERSDQRERASVMLAEARRVARVTGMTPILQQADRIAQRLH